jgi:hypothetical protein
MYNLLKFIVDHIAHAQLTNFHNLETLAVQHTECSLSARTGHLNFLSFLSCPLVCYTPIFSLVGVHRPFLLVTCIIIVDSDNRMKRPLLLVHVFVLLQSWPSLPAFAILNSHSRYDLFAFFSVMDYLFSSSECLCYLLNKWMDEFRCFV